AFLWFFGVLSIGVFVALGFLRDAVGRVLDKRAEESVAPTRLLVGRMPKTEDCLAVAYMREGERGVANTLISEAVAEGWLGPPTKEKEAFTFGGQRPRRAAARAFYNAIAGAKKNDVDASTVQAAAKETANDMVGRLDQELAAAGMVRDAKTTWTLRL